MSAKEDGKNKEYEVAATELVDLEDFRKYMAEEEESARAPAPSAPSPAPAAEAAPVAAAPSRGPSPASETSSTQHLSRGGSGAPAGASEDAKLASILGFVSLVPFVGLLAGPAAMVKANQHRQAVDEGRAPPNTLQQANLGFYLGAVGIGISIAVLFFSFL